MSSVGGFAGQFDIRALIFREQFRALQSGEDTPRGLENAAGETTEEAELTSLGTGGPREAGESGGPANPDAAAKAALYEQFGPQYEATVQSMRMKIQLSGEMGNIFNDWAKQAELLVSAFIEGQGFIDSIMSQFPDEASMPPEIKSMLDEIMRLQDSTITLLNSALGTNFSKDEFRELVGAKQPGKSGGESAGESGTESPEQASQDSGGTGSAEGSGESQGAEGAGGGDAEEKLIETLRGLMDEARSLIAAARANPERAGELAAMALQKASEGMLIVDTIEALQKALGGGLQSGNSGGILSNPISGADALGAMNIGAANRGGANLGGSTSGIGTGGIGTGGPALSLGSTDPGSGGLQQEANQLSNERDALEQLAQEALEMLGGDPSEVSQKSQVNPDATPIAGAGVPAQFAIQNFGSDLFSGSSSTFRMPSLIA